MRQSIFGRAVMLACTVAGSGAAWSQAPAIGIAPVNLTQASYEFDTAEQHKLRVTVVARGMPHPFSLALLPDGDALISERGGSLRLLRDAGATGRPTTLEAAPVTGLPAVEVKFRNAGLQDIALHPQFATNRLVYFTFNKPGDFFPASGATPARQQSRMAILRARFDGKALTQLEEIFLGDSAAAARASPSVLMDSCTPSSAPPSATSPRSWMSRPARCCGCAMTERSPPTIPSLVARRRKAQCSATATAIRSDSRCIPVTGGVLAAEHGPNGGDEVNLIQSGKNYGWPRVTFGHGYDGAVLADSPLAAGIEPPLVYWVPSIGPTGLLVYTGDRFPGWKLNLFVGSVRRGEIPRAGRRSAWCSTTSCRSCVARRC